MGQLIWADVFRLAELTRMQAGDVPVGWDRRRV